MRKQLAKDDRGTKREDPETGKKFYDLNKDPIVSPYTGKSYPRSYFEQGTRGRAAPERDEEEEEEGEGEEGGGPGGGGGGGGRRKRGGGRGRGWSSPAPPRSCRSMRPRARKPRARRTSP